MDMISSIMLPDSIVVEHNNKAAQNNLINSQKFMSSNGGDSQTNFFKQNK
jgi:hypothetical protein